MTTRGTGEGPVGSEGMTVKQQRAAQRAAKLEKYRKQNARDKRNKRIGLIAGILGAAAVVALLVVSVVLTPRPATYQAGGEGADIPGVETFQNTAGHVETPVDYAQTPPAGGEHSGVWLNCGVYSEPVPNENANHSLEHGTVWVTYDAEQVSDADVTALRDLMPASHALLSPYEGMDTPIVVSAWNAQLKLDSVDREKITQFFEEYWQGGTAPEAGASCSGALDAPGKVG